MDKVSVEVITGPDDIEKRYDVWLSKEEAARRIGMSERNLERLIKAGDVRKTEKPRSGMRPLILIHPEDVERLQNERHKAFILPPDGRPDAEQVETQVALLRQIPDLAIAIADKIADAIRPAPPLKMNLTLDEAAAASGLPRRLLALACAEGRLRAHRYGRSYFIHRQDLENFRAPAASPFEWDEEGQMIVPAALPTRREVSR